MKRFFKPERKSEVGVVSRGIFNEWPRGQIEAFEFRETEISVVRPGSAKKVGDLLSSLERMLARAEFEIIGADSFIDIEFS